MKNCYLLILLFLLISCNNQKTSALKYSTTSNALKYYNTGWIQIMDEGRYGASEISYRKVLEYDPDFLVGKSVLARLTLDLDERLKLYEEIKASEKLITGDERLILDVYTAFVKYTNLRDQSDSKTKNALKEALEVAQNNLKIIVHKHPDEIYLKAEYIEILNSLYGPKRALDSLNVLASTTQKDNPFLLGFTASMHAALEGYEEALNTAYRLQTIINDSTQPKTNAVFADIYYQMGKFEIAKINADKATALDPRNLDASRLKKKIDDAIENKSTKPSIEKIKLTE